MLFLQILSTEGRVVGLCWEHLKPKGPKRLEPADYGHPTRGCIPRLCVCPLHVRLWAFLARPFCLTESVDKEVLQKSIPPQIRQLILYYYQYTELTALWGIYLCKTTL